MVTETVIGTEADPPSLKSNPRGEAPAGGVATPIYRRFPPRRARKGTGMWPFAYPRPWDLAPELDLPVLIDPMVVASEVSIELARVGWPGFGLMSTEFQMSLLADGADVGLIVEGWFEENRIAVADEIERRVKATKWIACRDLRQLQFERERPHIAKPAT